MHFEMELLDVLNRCGRYFSKNQVEYVLVRLTAAIRVRIFAVSHAIQTISYVTQT